MGRDDAGGGSDLPAPYRNPWGALREDLLAVLADLRLRAREMWRRNGEGALWRPGWWPRDLAPLFWPLVVGGAMALVLAVLAGLMALLLKVLPVASPSGASGAVTPSQVAPAAGAEVGRPSGRAEEPAADQAGARSVSSAVSQQDVDAMGPEELDESADELDGSALATPAELPDAASTGSPSPPSPGPADPLAQLLERPEAAGLIQAAEGEAETGTLVLQLSPAFDRLSEGDQRRRADLWQAWAMELGYDHLELRDRRAGLRGRDALVGDGMILFSPQSPT